MSVVVPFGPVPVIANKAQRPKQHGASRNADVLGRECMTLKLMISIVDVRSRRRILGASYKWLWLAGTNFQALDDRANRS